MNKIFFGLFFIMLTSSIIHAANKPNSFECTGSQLTLTYTTTSKIGEPTLSYQRDEVDISAEGEAIRVEKSVLGSLVSVQYRYVPDKSVSYITVILPDINLDSDVELFKFKTVVVDTSSRTSFGGGPGLVHGVVQNSEYYPVICVASRVDF